jgi:hypothetical protein
MEYQLEIYGPGSYNEDDCIKLFTSSAPFLPLRAGDLLLSPVKNSDKTLVFANI